MESNSRLKIPESAWPFVTVATLVIAVATYFVAWPKYKHGTEIGYVGPSTCTEQCHVAQGESWAQTRMANSFDALRAGFFVAEKEMVGLDPDADYTEVTECLYCHTTGYGKVGGFVSIEETPEMAGVTCEACHGPGGRYVKTVMDADDPTFKTENAREAGLIYPPSARICRGCHNEDSPFIDVGYEFNYAERVAKGTHEHFRLKYDHD